MRLSAQQRAWQPNIKPTGKQKGYSLVEYGQLDTKDVAVDLYKFKIWEKESQKIPCHRHLSKKGRFCGELCVKTQSE